MPQLLVAAIVYIGTATGTAFLVTYAATIASTLLLVGGLAYSALKQRQAQDDARNAYNAAQVDRLVSITSSVAPRELVLGRVRKSGAVFFKGSTGTQLRDFYAVIALAGHEVDGIEAFYLNDEIVTLDGAGLVTSAPYSQFTARTESVFSAAATYTLPAAHVPGSVSATYYNFDGIITDASITVVGNLLTSASGGNLYITYQVNDQSGSVVQITTHLGAPGQAADAGLLAAFPAEWSAANTVTGVAYVVAKFTYSETAFPNGVPNLTVVMRGARVFDPRTGLTVYSSNPALMMRHVYQHPKFGRASVTAAEDARFIAAANACDLATTYTVAGVPSVRPLYEAALVVPYGTPAKAVFDDLVQAMAGSHAFAGGELYIKVGAYTAPVMALGDNDLAVVQRSGAQESQQPISISTHQPRANKYNTVKVKIWDAAQDYKQVSLTPLVGAALLARDGSELVQEFMYPAVPYAPQALHIAGIGMRDARDAMVLELPFKLRAYPLQIFDVVTLNLSRYGFNNKQFMVLSRTWSPEGALQLQLKETSAAITQMDAGFLAQGFAQNTTLPKPWDVGMVGPLTIYSGDAELYRQADGSIISRMRVTWPQIDDAAVRESGRIEVQYRRADGLGPTGWQIMFAQGDDTQAITSDVADGMFYIVRARARTSLGIGNWNTQKREQVRGKQTSPPPFDYFTVGAQPDGTRQYNFGYSMANGKPLDWLGAEIRYVPGSVAAPDWATMTRLQDETTYYTNSPVEINAPLAGLYTFACKSLDTTNNTSTYLLSTVTLPARRLGSTFAEYAEQREGWLGIKVNCMVAGTVLDPVDSTTWATLPATWALWVRWNSNPATTIIYTTPVRDFGSIVVGSISSAVDADGTVLQELAISADGITFGAWLGIGTPFVSRYIKLRLTVTASVPAPIVQVRAWTYEINTALKKEYINNVDASLLVGAYRIGTGDIRLPLVNSYAVINLVTVQVEDNRAGAWSYQRIDSSVAPGPRYQFKLNGTLTDPQSLDFYIEGY